MKTKMSKEKTNTSDLNSRSIGNDGQLRIYELIEKVAVHDIDCGFFKEALDKSEPKNILKSLAEIELSKRGKNNHANKFVNQLVNETIFFILSNSIWESRGIRPVQPVVIGAGGFSWIAQVEYGYEKLAMTIPKYRSNDYEERVATRRTFSDTVPIDIGFSIPRVRETFTAPFATALMTIARGDNCYIKCFDSKENSITSENSISVFKQLGYMAAGFSKVGGNMFGPITAPKFSRALEYLAEKLEVVKLFLSKVNDESFLVYGYNSTQLTNILNWVITDLYSDGLRPCLVHSDLSPWNLHHDPIGGSWTITDGDDSFLGVDGQQIGVCLISMRGNDNSDWIRAIVDGYSIEAKNNKDRLLLRGSAYGVVTYGLYEAARATGVDNRAWDLRAIAPLVRLFHNIH